MSLGSKLRSLNRAAHRASRSDTIVFGMTGAHGISGGIASLNRNILLALESLVLERGLKLYVVSLHDTPSDIPSGAGAHIYYTACSGDKKRFSAALMRYSFRARLTLVDHVRLALPLLPFSYLGFRRLAIVAHGPEAWRNPKPLSIPLFQSADLCIANSAFTLRKMQERFSGFQGVSCPLGLAPEHNLHDVIPTPPSDSVFLKNLAGKKREIGPQMFLLVGRMHSQQEGKGHRDILRALTSSVEKHPDVQVVFAGTGDDSKAIAELAVQLSLQSHVFMPGFVTREMLEQLYRVCYAFVMPSRQDGFGLVYLEAMNYGKPCVGCFDDGGECVVSHEETGFLVHAETIDVELSEIFARLLKKPSMAAKLGRAGFERLHREFSSEQFQNRLRGHLRALLD